MLVFQTVGASGVAVGREVCFHFHIMIIIQDRTQKFVERMENTNTNMIHKYNSQPTSQHKYNTCIYDIIRIYDIYIIIISYT